MSRPTHHRGLRCSPAAAPLKHLTASELESRFVESPLLTSSGPIEACPASCWMTWTATSPLLTSSGPIEARHRRTGTRRPARLRCSPAAAPLKPSGTWPISRRAYESPLLTSSGPIEAKAAPFLPWRQMYLSPLLTSSGPIEAVSNVRDSDCQEGSPLLTSSGPIEASVVSGRCHVPSAESPLLTSSGPIEAGCRVAARPAARCVSAAHQQRLARYSSSIRFATKLANDFAMV